MKKRVLVEVFCLVIFYPLIVLAVFTDKVVEDAKSSVVALYEDKNLSYLRGSGFFIDSSGTIITAKHVAKKYPQLWAQLYDGRKLELIPASFQESDDLAIMLPKISKNIVFPYLKLGDADSLSIGKPVMAIGNSLDSLWQVLYGNIKNLRVKILVEDYDPPPIKFNSTIEHNIIMPKGFSGSPLVDENGAVLGINIAVSKVSSDIRLSYAISLVEIKLFVEEFSKNR